MSRRQKPASTWDHRHQAATRSLEAQIRDTVADGVREPEAIAEPLIAHGLMTRARARQQAMERMEEVGSIEMI